MHKGKTLEAFKVWKRIRGIETSDAREEFFVMKASQEEEDAEIANGASNKRFPWMDFFTNPRARRALVYANIMISKFERGVGGQCAHSLNPPSGILVYPQSQGKPE